MQAANPWAPIVIAVVQAVSLVLAARQLRIGLKQGLQVRQG
jgi:hypothetical protein